MANETFLNAGGGTRYRKTSGDGGSSGDPAIAHNNIDDPCAGTQTNDIKVTLDGEAVTETNSAAILADTAAMDANLATIAGAVSGSEVQVDVVTIPTVTETNSADILADTDAMNTNLATVAGAVSGSEVQVDIVAALPAGTNAIGKLAANSGVDIGDVDVTSIGAGVNAVGATYEESGAITINGTEYQVERASISAATSGDNTIVTNGGSGEIIRVLAYKLVNSSDTDVNAYFRDGTGGTAFEGAVTYSSGGGGGVCPHNLHGWFNTSANAHIVLNLSESKQMSGHITFIRI